METKRDIRKNRVEYENPISKTTENIIEEENTLKEKMKFIAMNRFKIVPNREKDFENIWKNQRNTSEMFVSGCYKINSIWYNPQAILKNTHTCCMHLILPSLEFL